jgi:hypothetical protein
MWHLLGGVVLKGELEIDNKGSAPAVLTAREYLKLQGGASTGKVPLAAKA